MSDLASNNGIHADFPEFARDGLDQSQVVDRLASSNRVAPTQYAIPVRIEASQLAWLLERGAVAAAGYVIVMVYADARMSRLAALSEPGSAPADVDGRPVGNAPEIHPMLHPEPVG